jgi:hypothetical protein
MVTKVGMRTIDRVEKRFIENGIDVALEPTFTKRVYENKMFKQAYSNQVEYL